MKISGRENILKLITMERVLNTSCRHEWAQGVSFLIPQRLGRIKYLSHFQVRVQTQITMERVLYSQSTQKVRFFILSNSVVWNTISRHFLLSILYVIYNSYLRLLIWGRNGLMNFVLICWLLFFCFFHGMQWNLAMNAMKSCNSSSFLIPSFPGPRFFTQWFNGL